MPLKGRIKENDLSFVAPSADVAALQEPPSPT